MLSDEARRKISLHNQAERASVSVWALRLAWILEKRRFDLFLFRSGTSQDESLIEDIAREIDKYRLEYRNDKA